jgi:hypothetical protein
MSIVKASYPLVPEKVAPAIIGRTSTTTEEELYGRDTYCLDSLRPGRMARGKVLLAQRLYHRLITPRGSLRGGDDEANFGLDLAGKIGSTNARDLGSMLPVQIKNELEKDAEVDAVKVTATSSTNAGQVSWSITISVTPNTVGPFDLVLAASAVTVELLGVR